MLFHQEHELSKRVQSAREAEWEKITQLEQAKLQVSTGTCTTHTMIVEGWADPFSTLRWVNGVNEFSLSLSL